MSEAHERNEDSDGFSPGVFVIRGLTLRIPPGGLRITTDAHGIVDATLELHVGLDVCPTWLDIAAEHLQHAQAANRSLLAQPQPLDDERLSQALETDLRSSMQAVVATAAAVDAFYGVLQGIVPIDEVTKGAWRERRTARYKRIAEVVRRAFRMRPRNAAQLRSALRQLYHFRDLCVHPDLSFGQAVPHPEARRATAKIFATFRYPNARELAGVGLSLVGQACTTAKSPYDEVAKYCEHLRPRIVPILDQWEVIHRQLFKRLGAPMG